MRRLLVAPLAERDIARALDGSLDRHGPAAADRYARLIDLALAELRLDPERPGSRPAPVRGLRLYPLRVPARRLPADEAVRAPPHLVAYGFDADSIRVARLLHAAMDLPARLRKRA